MLQPRALAATSSRPSTSSLLSSLYRLTINIPRTQTRNASHASQGRANKAAPGPGKRLGAKKSDSEPVVPGNIIFRQRGTLWFPGDNCTMGRDHTISANAKGFVRYYRDPGRNPDKKYIGVVFEQHEQLPRARDAPRRRRLGLNAVVMEKPEIPEGEELAETVLLSGTHADEAKAIETTAPGIKPQLSLRQGFQYRESNWSIGRTAERRGISVEPYDPKNRWAAWRRRAKRKERAIEFAKLKKSTKQNKGKNKKKAGNRQRE